MIHYVRFVRVPEVRRRRGGGGGGGSDQALEVACSFDVRNDLGEALCRRRITVAATLFDAEAKKHIASVALDWLGTEWTRDVVLPVPPAFLQSRGGAQSRVVLRLSCRDQTQIQPRRHDTGRQTVVQGAPRTLLVASTQSAAITLTHGERAEPKAQRLCFAPDGRPSVAPWERVGSTIYGHVWDAGAVLAAHLIEIAAATPTEESRSNDSRSSASSPLAQLYTQLPHQDQPLAVVELGSGVGIVSLAMAVEWPNCAITLTDTEDARELLAHNIDDAKRSLDLSSRIEEPLVLHWDRPADRKQLDSNDWKVILVSDCTYNAASVPSLVATILAAAKSAETLVIVALKRRHEDESVFYSKMQDAGFKNIHHQAFVIPDEGRSSLGLAEEEVELHQYRLE